jgi:hypothetical protein
MELTPAKFCRGKIDRSAEALGVRHHPFLFPSESKTLQQHRTSNPAVKDAKSGHHHIVAKRCAEVSSS